MQSQELGKAGFSSRATKSKDQAYLRRNSLTALLWELMKEEQASRINRFREICKQILPGKPRDKEEELSSISSGLLLVQSWDTDPLYHLLLEEDEC